ncbi:asparagine synthase (glutamine-hydrolyzing) [Thauera sp. UPWRP]|nr:asparagine synthase (glutamine-hydrolyzing) [Thauera sp. UPWRP]
MCGISGFALARAGAEGEVLRATVGAMAAAIRHRGPDDCGAWADARAGVALGHARLAIIDLSPAGHQPMVSPAGRYVIAFNGEIYNHLELRAALEAAGAAPAWRGHSDTETLLAGFEHWGVEETLQRAVGMFAIALWDAQARMLTLARDRFGEKPLYFGWAGQGAERAFVFGSELKSLRAYAGFDASVCREALAQYLRFTYVPAPLSIYQGVYKLPPGCLLTIEGPPPAQAPQTPLLPEANHGSLSLRRWWSLAGAVEDGARRPLAADEALPALTARLQEAVRIQSLADVPLGAFLSGGVDSATIVALMQAQARRPVQTFTIGFEEAGFDESPHARAVAQHLGTDHHELFVSAADSREVIPRLPWMYDEPFADSSQVPTHLVCQSARRHVAVALSGDAGDELFGGYNRYFWGPRLWRRMAVLPYGLRQGAARTLQAVAPARWDALLGAAGVVRPGEKLHKLGRALQGARTVDDLYANLVGEWPQGHGLVRGADGAATQAMPWPERGLDDAAARMMYQDAMTYLPDDILCKVDRAAMAVSLETRVPFLDHRVAELAWRLPMEMKVRGGVGKWALRQVLYQHVPRELIERPKAGFAIPIGQWLRGPLRAWAETLLDERRLEVEGYYRAAPIRTIWREHLSGSRDWTPRLWTVLMFQAWLEAQG